MDRSGEGEVISLYISSCSRLSASISLYLLILPSRRHVLAIKVVFPRAAAAPKLPKHTNAVGRLTSGIGEEDQRGWHGEDLACGRVRSPVVFEEVGMARATAMVGMLSFGRRAATERKDAVLERGRAFASTRSQHTAQYLMMATQHL